MNIPLNHPSSWDLLSGNLLHSENISTGKSSINGQFSSSLSGWWLSHPSEKWWSSSVGMMKFPTEWKVIKFHGSNPPTSYVSLLEGNQIPTIGRKIPGKPRDSSTETTSPRPGMRFFSGASVISSWDPKHGDFRVILMGFYGDLMGFYRDSMGWCSDLMGLCSDLMEFMGYE